MPKKGVYGISNKPLGGPTSRQPVAGCRFFVTLTADFHETVRKHVEGLGVSASAWFRQLAEKELEKAGKTDGETS